VAFRTALAVAREIGARPMAGVAGSNLGALLLRAGRFDEARPYFEEAHATFAALGNDHLRLAALYNLAHLARAEGDAGGAVELYGAAAALAAQVGRADVRAGALAGGGLAELDLGTVRGAVQRDAEARALLTGRDDWWFQGRELCEALAARLGALTEPLDAAAARLVARLERVERGRPARRRVAGGRVRPDPARGRAGGRGVAAPLSGARARARLRADVRRLRAA
jgi:tetratricopeptide (TPR) repeat protein